MLVFLLWRLSRLANTVRLALSPKSVTDVEGVKEIALALKAARKPAPKQTDKNGGAQGEEDQELQPLVKDAPRYEDFSELSFDDIRFWWHGVLQYCSSVYCWLRAVVYRCLCAMFVLLLVPLFFFSWVVLVSLSVVVCALGFVS